MKMKRFASIKAVVVDLDNTLLHTDKTLSEYTVSVLKKCKERDIKILVATARPYRTATDYFERVGFDAIAVSNGARVFCGDGVTEHGISPESAERVLNALKAYEDLYVTVETGTCAYSNKPIVYYPTVVTEDLVAVAKREGALKILVHNDREDTLEIVHKALPEDLYATVSGEFLIQVMDKTATKWNGVKTMLESLRVSPCHTAYFGDDNDDVEPIRRCGMGVAVANAIEEAKAVADYITLSNDEDGVAHFLEQILA